MKILLVSRMDGWMGIYWHQFARGFVKNDLECRTYDYRGAGPRGFFRKRLPGDSERRLRRSRTSALISALKELRPDALLLHSLRLDLPALREAFDGSVVCWDIDGPAGAFGKPLLPDLTGIDLICTVSKPVMRRLRAELEIPVQYLPHAADLDSYRPGPMSRSLRQRFSSPLAFLGRPTERRIRLLEPLATKGLTVWGARWWENPWNSEVFEPCRREKGNIIGEEVAALYRAANLVLNISREPFVDPPTTLNLQAFHVPAAGTCLLTEWVEELEEAFEVDREVLAFKEPGELVEKALRYGRDRDAALRIGEAGNRRCREQHGLHDRAERVIALLRELKG